MTQSFLQKIRAGFLMLTMNLSIAGVGMIFVTPEFAYAETAMELITNGGFESAPTGTGWAYDSNSKWNINQSPKHAGDKSAEVKGSTTPSSILLQSPVSTAGKESIVFSFWYNAGNGKNNDENDGSLEGSDFVKAEYTTDGTNWTTFFTISDVNDSVGWHQVISAVAFSGAANNPNFGIRFKANLNAAEGDRVYIDDVSVTGMQMENTLDLCKDGIDNNGDHLTDLADPDCAQFKPQITVIKHVIGGDHLASFFDIFVKITDEPFTAVATMEGNETGTAISVNSGSYNVLEDEVSGYTTRYDGTCNPRNLVAGDHVTCMVTNTYVPPPVCPEGQTGNPPDCVIPPPPSCDTQLSTTTVVSDTTNLVEGMGGQFALATFVHSAWASITGSTWIWDAFHVAHPDQQETKDFTKEFTIAGTATGATLEVAADNSFTFWINGTQVAADPTEVNYSPVKNYTVNPSLLTNGLNTVKMEVVNFASGNDPELNPAGALYKLTIAQNACVPPPPVQPGKLVLVKHAIGGNGTFNFTVRGSELSVNPTITTENGEGTASSVSLTPDVSYTIDEPTVPEGWNFTSVACEYEGATLGDVGPVPTSHSIKVESGETVTCTYTNTKQVVTSEESDFCPNIAGNQTEIPSGMEKVGGQCVDIVVPLPTPTPQGGAVGVAFLGGNNGGGLVLGVATSTGESCREYITDYLRIGTKNNPEQVKLLQIFLNKHLGANIPVTGFFGPITRDAVKQFQLENTDQVLTPWALYGLPNLQPTGYVYKTTKRWINLLECKSLDIPLPSLP